MPTTSDLACALIFIVTIAILAWAPAIYRALGL